MEKRVCPAHAFQRQKGGCASEKGTIVWPLKLRWGSRRSTPQRRRSRHTTAYSSARSFGVCQRGSAVPVVPLVRARRRRRGGTSAARKSRARLRYVLFSSGSIAASVRRIASVGSGPSEGGGRSR